MKTYPSRQQTLNSKEKDYLKQIVLARLNIMPKNISVSIGSQDLDKEKLIQHVQTEDEIGRQMMEMDLEFLQDLASGDIYADEQDTSRH